MYLGVIATEGSNQKEEEFYPKGYPGTGGSGSIAEAAFHRDLWDSGVKALEELGLVDKKRIGIIGFSRTGWYTEFALAHSTVNFRAATVADNVQYSMGEYWLHHDTETIDEYNNLYGGPPYGASAKNWLDYSVSFNLDKIHTPLLMEEMGHGVPVIGQILVISPLQILVDVLALDEHQRNAVDKADQIRPAAIDVAAYPEFAHGKEVVFLRVIEVEDLQRLFD